MAPTTADIATHRLAQRWKRAARSHTGDANALDAEIASVLGTNSSTLINRLRRIRAEARVDTEGSSITDEARISTASSDATRGSYAGSSASAAASRQRPDTDTDTALTELCWRDKVLTWSRGCKVVRTFTFSEPVLQAFWTWFEVGCPDSIERAPGKRAAMRTGRATSDAAESAERQASRALLRGRGAFSALQRRRSDALHSSLDTDGARVSHDPEALSLERALCIFFQQGILIHLAHRGQEYRIDLPFRPARAFPLPIGLFVLRQTEKEDVEIADRLQRQQGRLGRHAFASSSSSSASAMGYPFPDVASSMLGPQTSDFGPFAPPSDIMDEDDEGELASSILPMAFHLRRPFDELAQVDRYIQISESLPDPVPSSGAGSGTAESRVRRHLVYGPATPFTEVDETIVFVSQCTTQSPLPVLVTASHRSRSIRIYAFSATPTRPVSMSIILSSRLATTASAYGSSDAPSGPISQSAEVGGHLHHRHQAQARTQESSLAGIDPASMEADETSHDPQSSSKRGGIGRGLPSTRKSGRIELERRSSAKSVPMGRDPSGRSRRISAMHAGNSERRMTGRAEDVGSLARDRTMNGNVSQTVDGLRRQSHALTTHEAMLAPGNASVRISSSSAARLHRSSHAARTPYAGPRTASRQPGTAARTPAARTSFSMSMPRPPLDLSIDNFDLNSYPATTGPSTGKLGALDREGTDAYESGSHSTDSADAFSGLADLDNFARSFAAVALLEEIKVPMLGSSGDALKVEVKAARFSDVKDAPVHLYICVPSSGQTFCRQVQYRNYADEAGHVRRSLYSCKPDATVALSVLDSAKVAVLSPNGRAASEVVAVDADGSLSMWVGPVGRETGPLKLGSWRRWSTERQGVPDADTLVLTATIDRIASVHGTTLQLHFRDRPERVEIELDFEPRCSLTRRVLRLFAVMLSSASYASLKAAWITHRFGLDKPSEQRDMPRPDHDWDVLVQVLSGSSLRPATMEKGDPLESLTASLSHAEAGASDIFARWKALPSQPQSAAGQRQKRSTGSTPTPASASLSSYDRRIVAACLHLLAQESRLDSIAALSDLPRLVGLIAPLASLCALDSWVHYWMKVEPAASLLAQCGPTERQTTADPKAEASAAPFDIYDALLRQLKGKTRVTIVDLARDLTRKAVLPATQEVLRSVCCKATRLFELYALFAAFPSDNTSPARSTAHRVVERMAELGVDHDELRSLPLGLALPLLEAIRSSQLEPPMGWSADAFRLVYRADLAMHLLAGHAGYSTDLQQTVAPRLLRTLPKRAQLDPLCAQIFNKDFRLADVVKMLETTAISTVHVPEVENQPEAAVVEQHSRAVAAISERTKAVPVGRGMLFMASRSFRVTQKWRIPPLCLGVKIVPRGTTVEPDGKTDSGPLEWPEFHNGVASILEVSVARGDRIDSKWIFSHLGDEPTAKHAGFLFGLGLIRHLPALTPVHVFRYLKARHNLVTIGFLLGLAAAAVGTGDPAARHLLGMQLVAFLPPGSAPLNLSILTQTAGLLAMGLVFLGSNHRWTANRMLQQIGAAESPIPDVQSQHREAYSLSAGLALGLVMLGKGRTDGMASLPDKRILVKLEQLINGSLADVQRSKRKPFAAKVELTPDLSLTSIPASVALGLIFLRSNRADIADILWVPAASELLDYIRPDVLLVRVLARYLVLWDEIRCSAEWIDSVLPEWMRAPLPRSSGAGPGKGREGERGQLSEAAQLASINMKAGACFAMGLKYAGSQDAAARACLLQQLTQLNKDAKVKATAYFGKIRQSALRAAADLVTVSLAAVVAGSGNLEVLRMLRWAHGDLESERSYGSHMATHMAIGLLFLGGGRMTLGSSDSAISALLIAFFPRFPGSSTDNRAHLQAFRHLWVLAAEPRLLIAKDIETGEAATVPMRLETRVGVVGGSGDARSDEEERTRRSARIFTPIMLPGLEKVERVSTDTARYWPTSLQVGDSRQHARALLHSRILHVQRKTGYLSYTDDPQGSRSIFSRSLGTAPLDLGSCTAAGLGPSMEKLRELVHGFAGAGKHEELVERLCEVDEDDGKGQGLKALLRTLVMECLTLDKAFMLPSYLTLVRSLDLKPSDGVRALATINDVRFVEAFYEQCFNRLVGSSPSSTATSTVVADATTEEHPPRPPLVQRGLLSKILDMARQNGRLALESRPDVQRALVASLQAPETGASLTSEETQIAVALLWTVEEGRARLETMRELASLVRQSAVEARRNGETKMEQEEEVKALVDRLTVAAHLAVAAEQQQQQGQERVSRYLIGKIVEGVVRDVVSA